MQLGREFGNSGSVPQNRAISFAKPLALKADAGFFTVKSFVIVN